MRLICAEATPTSSALPVVQPIAAEPAEGTSPTSSAQPFKAALLKPPPTKTPSFKGWADRQASGSLDAGAASPAKGERDAPPATALLSPFSNAASQDFPQKDQAHPVSVPRKPAIVQVW